VQRSLVNFQIERLALQPVPRGPPCSFSRGDS